MSQPRCARAAAQKRARTPPARRCPARASRAPPSRAEASRRGTRAARGGRRRPRRTSRNPRRPLLAGKNLTLYQILREGNRNAGARAQLETRFPSSPRMVYLRGMPFPDFTPSIPDVRAHAQRTLRAAAADPARTSASRYAQADERSARLARGLVARGPGQGQPRRGSGFRTGPDWIVAFLAATRIGAVAIPLNTFYKPRELGFVLRHADVELLLTLPRFLNADYLERLEAVAPGLARQKAGSLHVRELPLSARRLRVRRAATAPGRGPSPRSRPRPTRIPPSTRPSCARSRAASRRRIRWS